MLKLLLSLAWILPFSALSFAEPVRTDHVTAELISEYTTILPGANGPNENFVGLSLKMIPHWHTYWRFPGDSGLPTEIVWHLPAGWKAGPIRWELPKRILLPPLVTFGYEGETLLGVPLKVPAKTPPGEHMIRASASWLVCREECIPEKAELILNVKVSEAKPRPASAAHRFRKLYAEQPEVMAGGKVIVEGERIGLELPRNFELAGQKPDFFPLAAMLVKGDAPPKVESKGEFARLWMEKAQPFDQAAKSLPGVLVYQGKSGPRVFELAVPLAAQAAPTSVPPPPAETNSPWVLVFFAFLGGLVLNLMPCVFPVLGIKVMSLVKGRDLSSGQARQHGIAYGAGVLACFWALANVLVILRSFGEAVGWGFQLQNPLFVSLLALLFTFIAADLLGFVQWSGRWMGAGSKFANKEGYGGSFFTGVLAVVVATPCTAPFMGTAIGATISQAWWVILLVFTALGLGLALPFVLLCFFPALLRRLPKPGAWMEKLKKIFALPIILTVFWLLWVVSRQVGALGYFAIGLATAALVLGLWIQYRFREGTLRILALVVLGLSIAGALYKVSKAVPKTYVESSGAWAPYSDAALREHLKAGQPVFVDFTAAWCLTCQINKKLVLDRASMQEFFRQKGVVLLLADWTGRDPLITQALERQGRIGVPLYLAYPPGRGEAKVLPQILTESVVREAFP